MWIKVNQGYPDHSGVLSKAMCVHVFWTAQLSGTECSSALKPLQHHTHTHTLD